ncbi:DNA methyltransferase [PinkBerry-associated phage LS06-2018-MD08]|nr:DNA methyltransferase [PinkBerry-associated phage LS06-2018-MD08]
MNLTIFDELYKGKYRILELYSGTQSWSKPFRDNGHRVLSVELNPMFTKEPFNLEQWTTSVADITAKQVIDILGGKPDIIFASPLCTTHSIAAISHHRQQQLGFGNTDKYKRRTSLLTAKSDKAKFHDELLLHTLHLIQDLKPKLWFIENPVGGMRKSPLMQGVMFRHTITYCSYGDNSMKPTDIWTNHPNTNFKERCFNGNVDCHHESAPRGSKTGTQGKKGNMERSIIPKEFCDHIYKICDTHIKEITQWNNGKQ